MKLVILTNILSPYRRFMYDQINRYCVQNNWEFHVLLMSESEPNRHWKYDDYKTSYTVLLKKTILNKSDYTAGFFSPDLKIHLNNIKPDIIVAGGAYFMLPVLQAIFHKKKFGYRLLYWSESNLMKREKISVFKYLFRDIIRKLTYKSFDGFWNAGKHSNDFINKYKKRDTPSFFMPNLVDSNYFFKCLSINEETKENIRREYQIKKGKKVIFCPARLSYEKGILEFLELYKNSKQNINAIFLIAGDGPLHKEIENSIKTINSDIRLIGYKNQDKILELYSITDIFLLPSNIDPNPLSCIEALHCGLPLLISEHVGNAPEVVVEGKNGYVFNYQNKEKTRYLIDTIISNDDLWFNEAKKISLEIAESTYNPKIAIDACFNNMKKVYSFKND